MPKFRGMWAKAGFEFIQYPALAAKERCSGGIGLLAHVDSVRLGGQARAAVASAAPSARFVRQARCGLIFANDAHLID